MLLCLAAVKPTASPLSPVIPIARAKPDDTFGAMLFANWRNRFRSSGVASAAPRQIATLGLR
jgi:hypothetical protein